MSSGIYHLPFRDRRTSRGSRPRTRSRSRLRTKSKASNVSAQDTEDISEQNYSRSRSRASDGSQRHGVKRKARSPHSPHSSPRQGSSAAIQSSFSPSPEPWTTCPPSEARLHMPPGMAEQYTTAGLHFYEPLPGKNFPHASYDERLLGRTRRLRKRLTKSKLLRELGKLDPPPLGIYRRPVEVHRRRRGRDSEESDAESTDENDDSVNGDDNRSNHSGSDMEVIDMQPRETRSIRDRAVANLLAIMHRCVANADFARAERAFAILLRTRVDNAGIDLRRDGLWELGAKILMHADRPSPPQSVSLAAAAAARSDIHVGSGSGRSRRGRTARGELRFRFENSDDEREAAKERDRTRERIRQYRNQEMNTPMPTAAATRRVREYYEYLIVQFPPPPAWSRSKYASAPDFYVAMYEVWIQHVDDTRRVEERSTKRHYAGNKEDSVSNTPAAELQSSQPSSAIRSSQRHYPADLDTVDLLQDTFLDASDRESLIVDLQDIRTRQLHRAREIARHMEGAITSFPYSDDSRLVTIRAMVEDWLADLCRPWAVYFSRCCVQREAQRRRDQQQQRVTDTKVKSETVQIRSNSRGSRARVQKAGNTSAGIKGSTEGGDEESDDETEAQLSNRQITYEEDDDARQEAESDGEFRKTQRTAGRDYSDDDNDSDEEMAENDDYDYTHDHDYDDADDDNNDNSELHARRQEHLAKARQLFDRAAELEKTEHLRLNG